jgi:hypothetical protein
MSVAVGTIVARNFLPFARVLAASLREHHPAVPFFTVVADRPDAGCAHGSEPFEIVLLDELGISDLRRLCFGYSRQQMSIAMKPHLLDYLLGRGFTSAIFLDADILVLGSLQPLFDATGTHAISLTPHLLTPLSGTDRRARDLNILQSGVYNGGFVGVSEHASARRFLAWWADRLHTHCRHDVAQGMHFDQRWLDLVPTLFDDVHIVRDAGCNVAYWNLAERASGVTRFFHFSGFRPENPQMVTRYSNHYTMETVGPETAALFARYVERLRDEGYFESRGRPYGFDAFDNGVPIPDVARRLYLEANDALNRFGDPFAADGPGSYFRWLNEPVGGSSGAVTRLWHAVYRGRVDLQRAFPDVFGADEDAFRAWIGVSGVKEHGVADAFAR